MMNIIIYILTGLLVGLSDHCLEGYLIDIREEYDHDYHHEISISQVLLWMVLGILWIPQLIHYTRWLVRVINRRCKSKKIIVVIQSMGLKKYDPIIITFIDGDTRYAGFNYVNKKRGCLVWFSPGTSMSGGGWDMTSYLTSIKKIEPVEHRPGVIW